MASRFERLVKKAYKDTVTVASFTGFSDSVKTYGSTREVKCRIEDSAWQENKFFTKEYANYSRFSTDELLSRQDLVWLPGTDTTDQNEAIEISRVDKVTDLKGRFVHYVVHL